MGKTIAEDLMEKGERRGRKKGRKLEAVHSRRRILLKQLRRRFGELPEETASVVVSCTDAEVLDSWLDRFATAATLGEVGIGE